MIAIRNPHLVQRLAHRQLHVGVAAHEPSHVLEAPPSLTVEEQAADALVSIENRDRYLAQSEATLAGAAAPVPPRPALWLVSASSPGSSSIPSPESASGGLAPTSNEEPNA